MNDVLLRVEELSKHYILKENYFGGKTVIKAVDDISFDIYRGETLGLIGESGSGKTTTGELILKLVNYDHGRVIYDGIDISTADQGRMMALRKEMQIIFQHTKEVLDPKMTIEELVTEPLKVRKIVKAEQYEAEVAKLLEMVGLGKGEKYKFPYQLSGGQRQRVGIARAIAVRPRFIVCDEPVSALDVSIQGQILNLILNLKKELDLTYLFITHDLKVVKRICDRIAVMHRGKIVEIGTRDEILTKPKDPYTIKLVNSEIC